MTSKASKKKKAVVEKVVEVVVEEEEVVEEKSVVEDIPRVWTVRMWKSNMPLAINEYLGALVYYESTDELAVGEVFAPRHRTDLEVLLKEVNVSTLSDGTPLVLSPGIQKLHFIKNLHLAGVLYSNIYADEAQFFYETE